MSFSKIVSNNLELLYDTCKFKHILEMKQINILINDYKLRNIRNIKTVINKMSKIYISNDEINSFTKKLFKIDKKIIIKKYILKIQNKIQNKIKNKINNKSFDDIISEFISINFQNKKIINLKNLNKNQIKKSKRNLNENIILIKLHKDNKIYSMITKNFNYNILNNTNFS